MSKFDRRVIPLCALTLLALPAHAASPEVEAAAQVFRSVANDPAKLATVCQLAKLMDEAGDHLDAATEEQIQTIVKQVGPEFETAWNLATISTRTRPMRPPTMPPSRNSPASAELRMISWARRKPCPRPLLGQIGHAEAFAGRDVPI